jgi:peroxiredoxin family protein/TusA-related sulfurtransferase
LPKDKEILVFCQVGLRGYLACRILSQKGYTCRNLTGGYKTYAMVTGHGPKPSPVVQELTDDTGQGGPPPTGQENEMPEVVKQIDACGLQCPGPIQKLRAEIDLINDGEAISITSTDPGFAADVPAWCNTTGNELVEVVVAEGGYRATIIKRSAEPAAACTTPGGKKGLTIVVFSNAFDRAVAAFIIANGAASMGYEVTMFFTFWGLNVLRRDEAVRVKKTLVEKMFGWMMPRGPEKLALSQMHMAGMGLAMIKGIMKQKNVTSLPDLIAQAQAAGARLVGCTMSMDLMGIKHEELIDGVEEGGVAMYLDRAGAGNVNLFI